MSRHSRGFSMGDHPQRFHSRLVSASSNFNVGADAITTFPDVKSPISPVNRSPISPFTSSSPSPYKLPDFPEPRPKKRGLSRLKPSGETLLTISHFVLPVLNVSLLAFIGIMNHAYIFPTSVYTSLPLRQRGYGIYKILIVALSVVSIAIGWLNVYVIRITFQKSPRAKRHWRFWKKYIFPCEIYISSSWFVCFPKRPTRHWPWGRPGGLLKMHRIFALLVLVTAGSWGLLASLAFRDRFADEAWENACGKGDGLGIFGGNTPGWELMAEIRVLNQGRVQYDGKQEENEKWGTSSRISFYTRGKKWDYDMDLVRRYDMASYGYGDWADGLVQNMERQGLGNDSFVEAKGVMILALSNFANSDNPDAFKNLPFMQNGFISRPGGNGTRMSHSSLVNSTSLRLNAAATITTTAAAIMPTDSLSPTLTPSPVPQPLSSLKEPYLSSADSESSSSLILNPFPIYSPPNLHSDEHKLHSPYPPIQKIIYDLNNLTYHLFLTNSTAPGFPAIEEMGGLMLGRNGGKKFGIALDQTEPSEETRNRKPWEWEWPHYDWEMNDGKRWRWDDYRRNSNTPSNDAGLCLPPRVTLRKVGLLEDVLGVFGVTRECGVVRVCGVRKGPNGGDAGGDEQDRGWESGGPKRDIEERWALAVGLIAFEVERWTQCCLQGE